MQNANLTGPYKQTYRANAAPQLLLGPKSGIVNGGVRLAMLVGRLLSNAQR